MTLFPQYFLETVKETKSFKYQLFNELNKDTFLNGPVSKNLSVPKMRICEFTINLTFSIMTLKHIGYQNLQLHF